MDHQDRESVASPGAEEIARQHIDAAFTADDVPAARRVGYAEGFLAARMHIMGTYLVNNTGHHGLHAQSLYCDEWKEDAQPVLEMTPEEERVLKALWVKYAADEHDGISEMYWPQFIKAMRDYAASLEARLGELERERDEARLEADDKIRLARIQTANFEAAEARAEAAEARNKELEKWLGYIVLAVCDPTKMALGREEWSFGKAVEVAVDRLGERDSLSLLLREVGETLPEFDGIIRVHLQREMIAPANHEEFRREAREKLDKWAALLTRLSSDTKEEK